MFLSKKKKSQEDSMRPFSRPPEFTFYYPPPALGKRKKINVKSTLSLQLPALGQQKLWMRGYLGVPMTK